MKSKKSRFQLTVWNHKSGEPIMIHNFVGISRNKANELREKFTNEGLEVLSWEMDL